MLRQNRLRFPQEGRKTNRLSLSFSLHAEGEQVVLTRDDGEREIVHLGATGHRSDKPVEQALPVPLAAMGVSLPVPASDDDEALTAPGISPLDGALESIREAFAEPTERKEQE